MIAEGYIERLEIACRAMNQLNFRGSAGPDCRDQADERLRHNCRRSGVVLRLSDRRWRIRDVVQNCAVSR